MTAGSSPDTGKSDLKGFVIPITQPPIVEIDTEATAAYIRLRDTKVVATKPYASEKGLVMLDFDADENVVGIEVVGRQEFSIRELIKQIPVKTSDAVLNATRYVAADLQPALILPTTLLRSLFTFCVFSLHWFGTPFHSRTTCHSLGLRFR
jgi:uncharacterized protein YuzE